MVLGELPIKKHAPMARLRLGHHRDCANAQRFTGDSAGGPLLSLASLELRLSLSPEMDLPMAGTAKCDEVFFHIASEKASRLPMMDLEIFGTSAPLAAPAIACEHLPAKPLVRIPVQSNPRSFRGG